MLGYLKKGIVLSFWAFFLFSMYYYYQIHASKLMSNVISSQSFENAQFENDEDRCSNKTDPNLPPLYIITPTYKRPEQIAELTRLSHTLMLVPNVHWLVVEDATTLTPLVAELLARSGLKYEHLTAPMPQKYKVKNRPIPKGVSCRNRGLSWVKENARDGVIYFADDDNTYDLQIFSQMRYTKKVSMWPVGLVTNLGVSSPVVKNGVFKGFYDGWIVNRKFPVDMAGFAVSVTFVLQRPRAFMPYIAGYEETEFLRSLSPFEPRDIELLADNCTKILVWHTQTRKNIVVLPANWTAYNDTNIPLLTKLLL